ncbi:MAG: enoyl-CoA hydratase-related protein, partial [Crocinitomicaceae bacterium]
MNQIDWQEIKKYEDILFEFHEGIAKITINRPERHNAFRPETNFDILDALDLCRENPDINIIVLTGAGKRAFCSGGDQQV